MYINADKAPVCLASRKVEIISGDPAEFSRKNGGGVLFKQANLTVLSGAPYSKNKILDYEAN